MKERVDPGDRGSEYRSLIGLPGGMSHPMYPQVEEAGIAKGFTLEAGKGNDPDTFGKRLVYVYDSNKFPFYQAEVYHQVSARLVGQNGIVVSACCISPSSLLSPVPQ